jgi:hypothetical protein
MTMIHIEQSGVRSIFTIHPPELFGSFHREMSVHSLALSLLFQEFTLL